MPFPTPFFSLPNMPSSLNRGMPSFHSIFFLWLVNPLLSHSSPSSFSRSPSHKAIFILAGQSNMSGRGGVINDTSTGVATWDAFVPSHCRPNPSILRLDAHLQWVEATEPLHRDIDSNKTCGVGPGMPFAHSVVGHSARSVTVGLVPCAIGGTTISQWMKGTPLYRQMIRRARAAASDGSTVDAVVWFQGESDTVNGADAASYGRKLEKLLLDLRADLQDPMLPIILVALASGEGPYVDRVREAQLGIDLLNVRVVDAKGLQIGPDNLHLTTEAQVHLGKKLGQAYVKFLPSPIQRNVAQNASPSGLRMEWFLTSWTLILEVALTIFVGLEDLAFFNFLNRHTA